MRDMMYAVGCVYVLPLCTACMSGESGELKVMSFCFLLGSLFKPCILHPIALLLLEMEEISMSGYGTVL